MIRYPFCALVLAITSWVTTVQAQGETPGNPPAILIASSLDEHGSLELVKYRTIYIGFDGSSYNERSRFKVSLQDVTIQTVAGKSVSRDEVRAMLEKGEAPILVTSWKEPVGPLFRKLFEPDCLVFGFPRDAPAWSRIQDPSRPVRQ